MYVGEGEIRPAIGTIIFMLFLKERENYTKVWDLNLYCSICIINSG
jgi:hypothetical protein